MMEQGSLAQGRYSRVSSNSIHLVIETGSATRIHQPLGLYKAIYFVHLYVSLVLSSLYTPPCQLPCRKIRWSVALSYLKLFKEWDFYSNKLTELQSYGAKELQSYRAIQIHTFAATQQPSYTVTELQHYSATALESYKATELQSYSARELQRKRVTELQHYSATALESYRATELVNIFFCFFLGESYQGMNDLAKINKIIWLNIRSRKEEEVDFARVRVEHHSRGDVEPG